MVRQALMGPRTLEKSGFFLALRKLAGCHGRLQDRMMITEKIEVSDEIPAFGILGDVNRGTYIGHTVAVKTARLPLSEDLGEIRKVSINDILAPTHGAVSTILFQRFYKRIALWSMLSHPNVMEFVGVQENTEQRQFVIVSEWMEQGNIMEFVENNSANRLALVHDFTSSPLASLT